MIEKKKTTKKKVQKKIGILKKDRQDKFIEELINSLGNITIACRNTPIDRHTYYQWKDRDKKFAQRLLEIPELQFDFVENKLMQRVGEGSDQAIIFYLKTKGSKFGYGEKQSIDITSNNKNENTIKIEFIEPTFGEQDTII